ncbi:MAG: putative transport system permease protein [Actinomycetota bacterium]|jgi:putative ABC transport system permease protein|nr:putative transport system permease protein [Actinomycetota bacterium]
MGLTWLKGLIRRRTGRMLGQIAGIAIVVLMLGSLGTFFTAARGWMTEQALKAVPVDWQVLVNGSTDTASALKTIAGTPGVNAALPVGYADTSGFTSKVNGTVQTTGPGKVLGLPAGYSSTFSGEIRPLVGASDGVLLAQQTAANLGATVGSRVTIGRSGRSSTTLTVAGVVDLPAADSLFQSIGAAPGSAPSAPPDNVMLLPSATWAQLFDSAPNGTTATQIHVDLSGNLPTDPGAAFADVVGMAKNLEASMAGGGLVGNNIGAQLDATRSDAIYAELLFLFLGLPGVIIAGLLTGVIASSGRDRRRREQALLRVRGASPRQLVRLATWEAVLTGAVGIALGLIGAALTGRIAFGTSNFGATTAQAVKVTVAACVAGAALCLTTIVVPTWKDARALTVADARAVVGTPKRPLWMRTYIDVLLLAAGGLIYWQAVRNGYQVVLAPEGVPTISVSYFTLLAPILFWVGAALMIRRLAGTVLKRGRVLLSRMIRPLAHGLSGVVGAGMSRQRTPLARGLVLMALAASFAVSVAIFDTTYSAQARVDAQLTNGADVAVTTAAATGLPAALASDVSTLPGIAAAEAMQHRFAYVGNDLQDLYGVNPSTIGRATNMSNAFFGSGTATQVLATLSKTQNGVLVSDETVKDFQLRPGDTMRLRLQSANDHAYHVVPFTYVGIAREFPTAPHDSFLVANASYVAKATGNPATQTLLVKTTASPPTVAAGISQLLGPASGATVQDIVTQQKITLSGLTAIDLAGLTKLELVFALLLAAGASGLVLALGLAERRRTFAIASALGAKERQLAAFVWSEAGFIAIGGSLIGVAVGWGIAGVVVKILTGVFDPPPEHLSAPWGYLIVLGVATAGAVIVAGLGMLRATRHPAMSILRDL